MMHLAVLFAAPALVVQEPEVVSLRFDPPVGASIVTTTTETHDLLLEELLTRRGAGPAGSSDVALRLRSRFETTIAEGYREESGRLRRRYLGLEGRLELVDPASVDETTGEWRGDTLAVTSPFEQVSVTFQPAAGHPDGFGRHYDGRALREQFLPTLDAPFDCGRVLAVPAGQAAREARVGDRWDLPPAVLQPLLSPTGFLAWRGDKDADEQILRAFDCGVAGNHYLGFDGRVEGAVTARVKALGGETPEARFAEVELEFDVTLRSDRSSFIQENRIDVEAEEGIQTLGARLSTRVKGGAVVRWSLTDHQPLGAVVLCDEVVELSVQILPPDGVLVEQSIRMTGGLANRLAFREATQLPPQRTEGR